MQKKKASRSEHQKPNFQTALIKLSIHMDSLTSTYKFLETALDTKAKDSLKSMKSLTDKQHGQKDPKSLSISPKNISAFNQFRDSFFNSVIATDIVPKSLFVSMVSQFDTFLYDLMNAIYEIKPELLKASEKVLKPGIILKFKKIESAKTYLIKKEIEDLLRESHLDHMKWLEKTLKIPLTSELGGLDQYVEITERRNLLVHADGIVNEHYLSKCTSTKLKENDKLNIRNKYFFDSSNYLYELAILMTEVIWRKLEPKNTKAVEVLIERLTFDMLKNKRYDLVIKILNYNLKLKISESTYLVFLINLCLAYKFSGNRKEALKLVNSQDWEAKNSVFRFGSLIILEKYSEAGDLMKKIDKKDITEKDYQTWPLFKDFRKTKYFLTAYKQIFSQKYSLKESQRNMKRKLLISYE